MIIANFVEVLYRSRLAQAVFIVLCLILWTFRYLKSRKANLPEAELDEDDYEGSFRRAKIEFGAKPFIFGKDDKRIMLPIHLFEEIKNLPEDQISLQQYAYKIFNGHYTGLGQKNPAGIGAIRNELTTNINSTLAVLQDEIEYGVQEEFGNFKEWSPIAVYGKLLRVVALASGRIFVGLPLSRDEDWIDITINYTVACVQTAEDIMKTPTLLRPLVVDFYKSSRKSRNYRRKIEQKLAPQLQAMLEASKKFKNEDELDEKQCMPNEHFNLATWSMRHYGPNETPTVKSLAATFTGASFAAIHTTSTTLTHVLYDLAAHPECIPILRDELTAAMREEPDGKLRKKTMPRLRKMDSFIKESQRVHPLNLSMTNRLVTSKTGITLSSGDYLPYNSTISLPLAKMDSSILSHLPPQLPQDSLETFSPWRFSDLRSLPGEENKHQFVTATMEETAFGCGKTVCPGRFFANNEIKSVLIELLNRYDFGLGPDGEGETEGGRFKRPKTYCVKGAMHPDPFAKIYFRDRR